MQMRFTLSLLLAFAILVGATGAFAQHSHQLPANHLTRVHPRFIAVALHGHRSSGDASGTPGVDSLTNWNGTYKLSLIHISRAHETDSYLVCRLLLEKK